MSFGFPHRRWLARLATVLLMVGVTTGTLAAWAGAAPLTVTVAPTTVTDPLPDGFLGLALEYRTLPQWIGNASSPAQVDPVLVRLIRNLSPSGRPVIRIGGESTDRTWWPMPNVKPPIGITYALSPSWTTDVRSLAQALNAQLILSVNMEADSVPLARYEADKLIAGVGRRYLDALEIGNEAGLYTKTPWYRVRDGKDIPWYEQPGSPRYSRRPGYGVEDFMNEYAKFLAQMPNVPIAGPDAVNVDWLGTFRRLVSPHGRIRILDSHSYPLGNCAKNPASPGYPTIPHLLAPRTWQGILNGALPYVALAHHDGLQFRIDEMGSVTCLGRAGVSNAMASALWVTNALFAAARAGVDGVNLHTYPDVANDLFEISEHDNVWSAQVHPIYDGALMFARADPPGARLLKLSGSTSSSLQTWATMGADHRLRVLVDNEGGRQTVAVRPPAGFGTQIAAVQRLTAPSAGALDGLVIAGSSFDTTQTGALPAPVIQPVRASSDGYELGIPADSEALITVSPNPKPKPKPSKPTPPKKPTKPAPPKH